MYAPNLPPAWPDGKRFAFTIVDDTDCATRQAVGPIYDFLYDHGFRTTKTVWPLAPTGRGLLGGDSLQNPEYCRWIMELKRRGFEIAHHGTTDHASPRSRIIEGFDYFREQLGDPAQLYVNHVGQDEAIYWGAARFDGLPGMVYRTLQWARRFDDRYWGHVDTSPYFWGDLCQDHITYVRNFVFPEINTLKADPFMPYHDPRRPYVKYWFSSSHGAVGDSFCETLHEANQDRLVAEGGACIMYAHLACGFHDGKRLLPRFAQLMRRLADLSGWFAPASTLLDHLRDRAGWRPEPTRDQLQRLQRTWLLSRLQSATTKFTTGTLGLRAG